MIQPNERNQSFTNPLVDSTSPHLRQHAHNPVFWHPWGEEALVRAKEENKPIFLSIGYSSCHNCHVMGREVFENLSIASLMNRTFINIKLDREEHPHLDETYMVARQLMTQEGGWPNNVFLTPDLKPFYAGGSYGPDEAYGKPAFARVLEWINYSWTTQEAAVRKQADDMEKAMLPYLVHKPAEEIKEADIPARAQELFSMLQGFHDKRSGGFFDAPKFPHECYTNFLLRYYECNDELAALDIAHHTLAKIASGGIYDHVGCGFHRYAIDKEWYIPHFEKMLYNQALLARNYTDVARFTGSAYMADIAKSVLDFTAGPFVDGNGAFYSAIDAETNKIEGEYYVWTAEELQEILSPEETNFFVNVFALADIPEFSGQEHAKGQVIIGRKPLDEIAGDIDTPYVEIAAMVAEIMNKLLPVRNKRQAPALDNKIIVSWNGLMIDAYAHGAHVFGIKRYLKIARRAASFILEHAVNNDGQLQHIIANGRAQFAAGLEDYAYLIKGLLTIAKTAEDKAILDAAISLLQQVEANFSDADSPGYFSTQNEEGLLLRMKSADDSTLPNGNAIMLANWVTLFECTGDDAYKQKAQAMIDHFIGSIERPMVENAMMLEAALTLQVLVEGKPQKPTYFKAGDYNDLI